MPFWHTINAHYMFIAHSHLTEFDSLTCIIIELFLSTAFHHNPTPRWKTLWRQIGSNGRRPAERQRDTVPESVWEEEEEETKIGRGRQGGDMKWEHKSGWRRLRVCVRVCYNKTINYTFDKRPCDDSHLKKQFIPFSNHSQVAPEQGARRRTSPTEAPPSRPADAWGHTGTLSCVKLHKN